MSKGRVLLYISFILLILIYAPGLREELFLIDDRDLILAPFIKAPLDWELIKTWLIPGGHIDYYPVRDLTYWFDIHVFGGDPHGSDGLVFRIQNFFWVLISGIFLSAILKRLKVSKNFASLSALIWMIHPVHSELLMWPSARKDCLAIVFGLGAVYSYLRHQDHKKYIWGVLSILLFTLGLLSKISIALLPCAAPILGIVLGKKSSHWKNRNRVIWMPAILLGFAALIGQSVFYGSVNDMRFSYSYDYRIQASMAALGRALLGWFYPRLNAVDVENWGTWTSLNQHFIVPGVMITVIIFIVTLYSIFSKRSLILSTTVAFWLTYFPVCAWVFPHRNFYSVRYFEIPVLILWVGLSVGLFSYLNRNRSQLALAQMASSVLILSLIISSFSEAKTWESGTGPFEKALEITPENPSLMRMLLDQLINEDRWGRLDQEKRKLKTEISDHIKRSCGETAENDSFRNSHLCLGLWLDAAYDSRKLHLSDRSVGFAVRSLNDVNSQSAKRFLLHQEMLSYLKNEKDLKPESPVISSKQFALNTPGSRLTYWSVLCTTGRERQAREMLNSWRIRHLVDSFSIAEFLTYYQRSQIYADQHKKKIRTCYFSNGS